MEPSFDVWSVIFSISSVQGVFLSIMLFLRKSPANKMLGALILSFSVCMIYYVIFWTGYYRVIPWQFGSAQGLTLLLGPFVYFYLRSDKNNLFIRYRELTPFLLYMVYYISDVPPRLINGGVLAIYQIIHLAVYTVIIFIWLFQNKGQSNGALKKYRWQRKIVWAFTGYTSSFLVYYLFVLAGLIRIEYDYIISMTSSFFIYFIGYHGFQKPEILKMYEPTRYDRSALNSSASEDIRKKLNELMEKEKIYLKSSIKLQDIADLLGVQPHYISQVINEQEQKHFSDYVNSYRIEEAKKILIEKSYYKIIHVAYDTGFNNKASFNNAFKKLTGLSPSQYREQHLVPSGIR